MGIRLVMWEEGRMEEPARRVAQQSLDAREGSSERDRGTLKERKTRLGNERQAQSEERGVGQRSRRWSVTAGSNYWRSSDG
eukprot:1110436-Lingulodinium_polyedra.AAC.1